MQPVAQSILSKPQLMQQGMSDLPEQQNIDSVLQADPELMDEVDAFFNRNSENKDAIGNVDIDYSEPLQQRYFPNLADQLTEDEQKELANRVCDGYEIDRDSLSDLDAFRALVKELFSMQAEEKTKPWKGASNVRLPTILTACINAQARLLGLLFGEKNPVKGFPIGDDQSDRDRASRVEKYMNYRIRPETSDFIPDMDQGLMMLPREGFMFKKAYYNSITRKVESTFVRPEDIVVNYYTISLKEAYRITQKVKMKLNDLRIKAKQKIFINVDKIDYVSDSSSTEETESDIANDKVNHLEKPSQNDESTPRLILEQHTFYDFNNDGIKEPVVIFVDYETRTFLRLESRIHPKFISISSSYHTISYFTLYTFLPNDSSIYGYGFGHLLYNITHVQNTAINQLTDAAHLANLRGGFINRRSGITRGKLTYGMAEFKEVDLITDDISKAIMPLNFAPPSQVLINLVTFLQAMAEKLTTVTELFTGAMPRSDTSATATERAIEQGSKLFTGIQIRTHRAFAQELRTMYLLEMLYLDKTEFYEVVINKDDSIPDQINQLSICRDDFNNPLDVHPVSDPTIISQQEKINVAQVLLQTVNTEPLLANNPEAKKIALTEFFKAIKIPSGIIKNLMDSMGNTVQSMVQQGYKQGQNDLLKALSIQEITKLQRELQSQPENVQQQ
jgi:hypothetical protein